MYGINKSLEKVFLKMKLPIIDWIHCAAYAHWYANVNQWKLDAIRWYLLTSSRFELYFWEIHEKFMNIDTGLPSHIRMFENLHNKLFLPGSPKNPHWQIMSIECE